MKVKLLLLPLLLTSLNTWAQDYSEEWARALDKVVQEKYFGTLLTVSFGSFSYGFQEPGPSTPMIRFIEDKLESALTKTIKLSLFNRGVVNNMDPAFREVYQEYFDTNTVGGLLFGSYQEGQQGIDVRIKLNDLKMGTLLGTVNFTIPYKDLPSNLETRPSDTTAHQSAMQQLSAKTTAANPLAKQDFNIHLTTNRGAEPVFYEGENLVLRLFSERDCYFKLYLVRADGKAQLIFPNIYNGNNFLKASTLTEVPGDKEVAAGFVFTMTEPFGREYIKVVASTVPFKTTGAPPSLDPFTGDFSKLLSPASMVEPGSGAKTAESVLNYLIAKKP